MVLQFINGLKILYPSSEDVMELLSEVPFHRLTCLDLMESFFCSQYKADKAFIKEQLLWEQQTKTGIRIPYWRLVSPKGRIISGFGMTETERMERLKREGFQIIQQKNGLWKIADYMEYWHEFE